MFGEKGFVPKQSEELQGQLEKASADINGRKDLSLVPPSVKQKDILRMPIDEIKDKYGRRYEIYLKLLRGQKRAGGGEPFLTDEELDKMRGWLQGLNSLDEYVQAHKDGEAEILRERQVNIFEDLQKFIETEGKEGYVKVPTGVGKTVLFIELIEALNLKTIIAVPSKPLLEQTEERLEEFAPDLEVGKIYSEAKEHGRTVTIITYDSLISQLKKGAIDPDDYDCLILDEVHMALGPKRTNAIHQFKNSLKLGFTATPDFKESKRVSNILPKEIHRMDIREAVEEGLLSSFSALVAKTEVDLSQVALTENGEFNEEQLEKAVNIVSRNKAAVELYEQVFNGETAVAYCVNIKHAQKVAELFNEQGISAAVISGKTSKDEQIRIKREFKEGKIKILCNADILIPGFDEPRASVCLNLRPTHSRVIAEQRGGRVVRLDKNRPDKHAYIVDFIDRGVAPGKPIVLFADVAGGVEFTPNPKYRKSMGGGGGKPDFQLIDIPGLEIYTDLEEVMKIVAQYHEIKKTNLAYNELQRAAQAAGVKNSRDYRRVAKDHEDWPSNPDTFYGDEWQDWDGFLEREGFLSFEDLKAEVKAAGIRNSDTYNEEQKNHPRWHSKPYIYYGKEWRGWPDLWGKENLGFRTFMQQLKESGIVSAEEYGAKYEEHALWPPDPAVAYRDYWQGWDKSVKRRPTKDGQNEIDRLVELDNQKKFSELKQAVKKAGIEKPVRYAIFAKGAKWPDKPWIVFKKQWLGWDDFLGKK